MSKQNNPNANQHPSQPIKNPVLSEEQAKVLEATLGGNAAPPQVVHPAVEVVKPADVKTVQSTPPAEPAFVIPEAYRSDDILKLLLSLPRTPDIDVAIRSQVKSLDEKAAYVKEVSELKARAEEPMRIQAFTAEIKAADSPLLKTIQELLKKHSLTDKVMENRFVNITFPKGVWTIASASLLEATKELKGSGRGNGHNGGGNGHGGGNKSDGESFQSLGFVVLDGVEYNSANAFANKLGIKYTGMPTSRIALERCEKLDSNGDDRKYHPFTFTIDKTGERTLDNGTVKPIMTLTKVERPVDAASHLVKA